VEWYRPRDLVSTLILVGAVLIALIFIGDRLPEGPFRWLFWAALFFLAGALAPAPWIVPPTSLVFFWLAVAVTPPSEGGCPVEQFCEPVPNATGMFLLVSLLVLVSTFAGASLRYLYEWRKQLRSPPPTEDLPP